MPYEEEGNASGEQGETRCEKAAPPVGHALVWRLADHDLARLLLSCPHVAHRSGVSAADYNDELLRRGSGANTAAAIMGMRTAAMTPVAMLGGVRIRIWRGSVWRRCRDQLWRGCGRIGRLRLGTGRLRGHNRSGKDEGAANGPDIHVCLQLTHNTADRDGADGQHIDADACGESSIPAMRWPQGANLSGAGRPPSATRLGAAFPFAHRGFYVEGEAGNRSTASREDLPTNELAGPSAAVPVTNTKLARNNSPAFASSAAIRPACRAAASWSAHSHPVPSGQRPYLSTM